MILPSTTLASLLLLILTLFCWGSWANAQKLTSKWRFELFYCDFIIGVTACVLIAIFTLGSMNAQELTFSDNLLIASYRKMAYAFAAGMVLNLANMLLVGAISISGMAVVFPLTFSIGLIVTSLVNFLGNSRSMNAALLFAGMVLIAGAVLADVLALVGAVASGPKQVPAPQPKAKQPARSRSAVRGIPLGIASGIAFGFFFPIVDTSRFGDNGVGPYGVAGLVAAGMLFATVLYTPFFVTFPILGEPVRMASYFLAMRRYHVWGILGGFAWAAGVVAVLVEQASPVPLQAAPVTASMLLWGAPVLTAFWGAFVWSEFKTASRSSKTFLLAMVVLFVSGLTLMSTAQIYAQK